MGGLGDFLPFCEKFSEVKNYRKINEALASFAKENKGYGFVSAEGLTANPDQLHFNAPSLYEFGERYFAEFQKLRDPNKVFEEKCHPDDAIRSSMEAL